MEEKRGLENDVMQMYKQFDASVYSSQLATEKNEILKASQEIGEILTEFSMSVYCKNPNVFFEVASNIPGIGKYVKKVIVNRNGNAFGREREKQQKNVSKLEGLLVNAANQRNQALDKIDDLYEIKQYAVERLEESEKIAEEYTNKVLETHTILENMTRREQVTKEGVELQKSLAGYKRNLEQAEAEMNKNAMIFKNSEILITSYNGYVQYLKGYIVPASQIYNEMKFNLDHTDKIDLNLTNLSTDLQLVLKKVNSQESLNRIMGDAIVRGSDMVYKFVNGINKYEGSVITAENVHALAKNLYETGILVEGMMKNNMKIAKKLIYGKEKA